MKQQSQNKNSSDETEVKKYLTEMKEFPTDSSTKIEEESMKKHEHKLTEKSEAEDQVSKTVPEKQKEKETILSPKLIILGVTNLIFIITLALILGKLPQKTIELKTLKTQISQAENSQGSRLLLLDVENNKKKYDSLKKLLPNELGLIDFVKDIDDIRRNGVIYDFSFGNKEPIPDKTGYLGIPIIISLRGDSVQISDTLEKIQSLPYLIRAVRIETEYSEDESVINFKYGGFLYVDENFGQN